MAQRILPSDWKLPGTPNDDSFGITEKPPAPLANNSVSSVASCSKAWLWLNLGRHLVPVQTQTCCLSAPSLRGSFIALTYARNDTP